MCLHVVAKHTLVLYLTYLTLLQTGFDGSVWINGVDGGVIPLGDGSYGVDNAIGVDIN